MLNWDQIEAIAELKNALAMARQKKTLHNCIDIGSS